MTSALMLSAVEDSGSLWPHNEWLVSDEQVERAVRRALDSAGTTPDEQVDGKVYLSPRLVPAKTDYSATPLLEALVSEVQPNLYGPCDRCDLVVRPTARLWVPCGATVVQVECCSSCVAELNRDYLPVWR